MLTIFFILAAVALEMALAYLSVPVLTAAVAFSVFTLIAAISGASGWLLLVLILLCAQGFQVVQAATALCPRPIVPSQKHS